MHVVITAPNWDIWLSGESREHIAVSSVLYTDANHIQPDVSYNKQVKLDHNSTNFNAIKLYFRTSCEEMF